jgi:anaerobic selenocysteine-containing dehydrogenase
MNGLAVLHSRALFDALAQLVGTFPAELTWLPQLGVADLPKIGALHPAFVLVDPFLLQSPDGTDLAPQLRQVTGSAPIVALLPEDNRGYRDASLRMGANAAVVAEQAPHELLPILRQLLSNLRLQAGVSARIQSNAWNGAPVGESALGFDCCPPQRMARHASQTVEAQTPLASLAQPVDNALILRGLAVQSAPIARQQPTRLVRTACNLNCGAHFCGLQVHVCDGRAVNIEPADFPDKRYRHLCLKGISQLQIAAHPNRLRYPLKRQGERGSGAWQRISWEQALDEIYARFQEIRQTYGPQAAMFFPYSGQLSTLNGFGGVYLRLASLWGASATSQSEYGVDSAVPSGIEDTLGIGTGYLANDYTDLPNSRLVIIWGANPVYSRMNWWPFFVAAQEAGCQLVTIDPKFSATASKSERWLPIRPGTDLYLALGLIRHLIHAGLVDEDFIRQHTTGPLLVNLAAGSYLRRPAANRERSPESAPLVWDLETGVPVPAGQALRPALTGRYPVGGREYRPAFDLLAEMAAPYTPEFTAQKTGLPVWDILDLAELLVHRRPARIYTLYGVDRWHHGATFGRLIALLAALTGNLGQPGAGAGVDGLSEGTLFNSNFSSPDNHQYQPVNPAELPRHIVEQRPYPIKGVLVAFNNWLNQWPDQNLLHNQILPELDLLVCSDLFMTETARYADYVLPAAHLFEREDMVRGPGPYVQHQPAFLEPPGESRSDFEIAAGLAQRSGHGAYFGRGVRHYLQEILDEDATTAGLHVEELAVQGVLARNMETVSPVAHAELNFATPTGRVELFVERLAPFGHGLPVYEAPVEADLDGALAQRYPLVCITEHSRYRVHSTFGNVAWLRELEQEPYVLIHPQEAAERGIQEGELVKVFNQRGQVILKVRFNRAVPRRAVYVGQGWQSLDYSAGHVQSLTHQHTNPLNVMGPNISFSDVLVDLCKVEDQEGG